MTPEQLQKINQLDQLKADGTLSAEEYANAKARVLTPKAPSVEPPLQKPVKSESMPKGGMIAATIGIFAAIALIVQLNKTSGSKVPETAPDNTESLMMADSISAAMTSAAAAKASAASVEAAKSTIKRLRPLMRYKKDDFNGGWFYGKSAPRYTNYNGMYAYFNYVDDKTGPNNLRFVIQYVAEDWLFIERYRFLIAGKEYVYIPDEIKRDNGDGEIWEWFDDPVTSNSLEIIEALIAAKSGKVRMEGKDYRKDKVITSSQIADFKRVMDLYNALRVVHTY